MLKTVTIRPSASISLKKIEKYKNSRGSTAKITPSQKKSAIFPFSLEEFNSNNSKFICVQQEPQARLDNISSNLENELRFDVQCKEIKNL